MTPPAMLAKPAVITCSFFVLRGGGVVRLGEWVWRVGGKHFKYSVFKMC